MNELTKKLIQKAFSMAHEANDAYEQENNEEMTETEFNNKFDEILIRLMVQECVKVCHTGDVEVPMGAHYAKQIKKHFGVE